MKKLISLTMCAVITAALLTGCGTKSNTSLGKNNDKLKIVTTIFPEYDWVENIMGDKAKNAEVTMLLDNGVDLHSYQPTASDMMKIATCDMFIYVGGESDAWVDDALKDIENKDMVVINLLDVLGDKVKEEEVVEGMQEECETDENEEAHDHEDEDEVEYDEHVWLSLKNASALCGEITEQLCKIDEKNAETYRANFAVYDNKIKELDNKYTETIKESEKHTLLFGDRFPFRYLTDDYGLDYYAAFVGCSAETEASFETIVFLAKKVDELNLPAILTIEGSDGKIADTIRANTEKAKPEMLQLNSIQSVTSKDVKNGVNYLSIMEDNLKVVEEALK
ncbi:MAG: metal ABC transporter substrate-binding protein [Lachnospiraceae bacterium]|nr:metal ABC transporter substrate-binding protein [Lachnospiraceae bacterium]